MTLRGPTVSADFQKIVIDYIERRFGARPAEWHSDLTGAERRVAWRAIAAGEARVVVGARSALFLPYPDLGLIVVDEEQEQAYKQEDGVAYQARDMAVLRGHLARIPVVLVSATPSLETLQNVATGRYRALHLPDRHRRSPLLRLIAFWAVLASTVSVRLPHKGPEPCPTPRPPLPDAPP